MIPFEMKFQKLEFKTQSKERQEKEIALQFLRSDHTLRVFKH